MDADKVEVSTETKSERRKGKKDINFVGQKFRAPGGTGTCLLERSKGKKTYKFRSAKVPSPRWDWNLRRSQSCVNMMVFMQFYNP